MSNSCTVALLLLWSLNRKLELLYIDLEITSYTFRMNLRGDVNNVVVLGGTNQKVGDPPPNLRQLWYK